MKNYALQLTLVCSALWLHMSQNIAEANPTVKLPLPPLTKCPFASSFRDQITPSELGPTVAPPAGAGCIPLHTPCVDSKYRTLDGTCNNLKHPLWGASNTRYNRLLPARYSDNISSAPTSVTDGSPLPLPRLISLELFPELPKDDRQFTLLAMTFGQLLTHDITMAMGTTPAEVHSIQCCVENSPVTDNPRCIPLIFPVDDPFYSKFDVTCIDFIRTINDIDTGCNPGNQPAEQLVSVTHWLDASMLYGNSVRSNKLLREGIGGRLKVELIEQREYPPRAFNTTDVCELASEGEQCYQFGDRRGNQNLQLVTLEIILLRDHNATAKLLSDMNLHWDDERLFQEAKSILTAKYQYISYYEYLPILFGYNYMLENQLIYNTDGYTYDYDEDADPSILNEFATGAFRLYHSAIQGKFQLIKEGRNVVDSEYLSDFFNRPVLIENRGYLDNLARGMCTQRQEKIDQFWTTEVTNLLFKANTEVGADLKSVDILRDRDHAVASYNCLREFCGLPRARTFKDFLDYIDKENVQKLAFYYNHPDDVELVVGGALERLVPGALAGPTYLCIMRKQFLLTRKSDRYFFEAGGQSGSFTPDQLREIRKASMARLLCDNSDSIRKMQPWAFQKISASNPLVSCKNRQKIPVVDLSFWKESPPTE